MSARVLHIGDKLRLPSDAVTASMVVYGARGMGKTNFGAVLCEELSAAGLRFSYIDPMGHLWGLRHSADGKGRGIEVLILGGRHGDIPIEPTGGAVVADLVADEEVDCVIDISRRADGKMWSKGERIRFVTGYCKRLYERQGERNRPIMQIIDEAARFVPQIARHGDDQVAACIGAVEQMVEEGRGVGIGITLITQRSARLSKSVAELAEAMVAFRTIGPNSVDAILDWFGEHIPKERWKDLVEQLRQLPRGSALVVSPGWLKFEGVAEIRHRHTFDSSATPKPGQERRAHGAGAKPDLTRYVERMAETIKNLEAADPEILRKRLYLAEKRVYQLEAELKQRPTAPAAKPPKEIVREVPILKDSQVTRLCKAVWKLESLGNAIEKVSASVLAEAAKVNNALNLHMSGRAPEISRPRASNVSADRMMFSPSMRRGPPPAAMVRHVEEHTSNGKVELPKGVRTMLAALAARRNAWTTRSQLATLSTMSASGGSYSNYLSALRRAGFIEEQGHNLRINELGLKFIGADALPITKTTEELVAMWKSHLPAGARKMLDVLVREPRDNWISRGALAEASAMEITGGSWSNYLSALRRAGLIEEDGHELRASRTLFLEG